MPTPEQAATLAPFYAPDRKQVFGVALDQEYVVYCVDWTRSGPLLGIRDAEFEQLYPTPLCLFEIVDASLPRDWIARTNREGGLRFEPPSFREDYFESLADGDPETVADFRRVRARLESPASNSVPEA